ncbi:MAG: hypothetical protein QM778_07360 [Myxococcales bacterium]
MRRSSAASLFFVLLTGEAAGIDAIAAPAIAHADGASPTADPVDPSWSPCPCTSAPGVPTLSAKKADSKCKDGGFEFTIVPPAAAALCVSRYELTGGHGFPSIPGTQTVIRTAMNPGVPFRFTILAKNSLGSSSSPSIELTCQDPVWTPASYRASTDIAIGKNGKLWFIDGTTIYQLTPKGPKKVAGAATRIAVDPVGVPWVINKDNTIAKWTGSKWKRVPGLATDIGIGADGTVWILGTDGVPAKWTMKDWSKDTGASGVRISVGPDGNPWLVTALNADIIRRNEAGVWERQGITGNDLSVGPSGGVYVVGNSGLFYWDPLSSHGQKDDQSEHWAMELNVFGDVVAAGEGHMNAWVGSSSEPVLVRSMSAVTPAPARARSAR